MAVDSLLRSTDYFRRSAGRIGGRRDHKEWLHFCIRDGERDVLVNFGVNDEAHREGQPCHERGQLIVLVREGSSWSGDVQRFWDSEIEIAGGEIYARLGNSSLSLDRDGSFKIHVSLALRPADIELELSLRPMTVPSLANNVAMAAGQSLSWLVVPRLQASGLVRVGSKTWHVERAVAYHDHNWGNFAWGGDFAWEWGYGLPTDADCPWTFMFVRLSDRAMARTRTQVLTVWRGTQLVRSFRGRQLRFVTGHALCPPDVFRVPPSMALLAPHGATEVPEHVIIEAEADGDVFRVELRPRSVAQIIVPNDGSASVTRINEVSTELRASGRILDEQLDYGGGGVFEVLAP